MVRLKVKKGAESSTLTTRDVSVSESWLYRNPEALAAVRRGLQEAAEGKIISLGSFGSYADED